MKERGHTLISWLWIGPLFILYGIFLVMGFLASLMLVIAEWGDDKLPPILYGKEPRHTPDMGAPEHDRMRPWGEDG